MIGLSWRWTGWHDSRRSIAGRRANALRQPGAEREGTSKRRVTIHTSTRLISPSRSMGSGGVRVASAARLAWARISRLSKGRGVVRSDSNLWMRHHCGLSRQQTLPANLKHGTAQAAAMRRESTGRRGVGRKGTRCRPRSSAASRRRAERRVGLGPLETMAARDWTAECLRIVGMFFVALATLDGWTSRTIWLKHHCMVLASAVMPDALVPGVILIW